ncbi:MAG: hypothetical protein LKF96_05265 [Treponema sp.]|jgi:hypothetical protein|nr:hypothetical protein [Treponema sp.]
MKKVVTFLFLSVFATGIIFSQEAQFLDGILSAGTVKWSDAVTLVLSAADRLPEDAITDENQAWKIFEKENWFKKLPEKQQPVSTAEYSYLIAKSFGMKGGIWYSLFPSPRYAFRELEFRGILPAATDPGTKIDGSTALYILQNALDNLSAAHSGGKS